MLAGLYASGVASETLRARVRETCRAVVVVVLVVGFVVVVGVVVGVVVKDVSVPVGARRGPHRPRVWIDPTTPRWVPAGCSQISQILPHNR